MIGALAHPLNQAIVDPEKNIVVAGYGILQPRVDISVQCTTQSRLAAIFAGETGLDPYTRAISDVYQDLYGEGFVHWQRHLRSRHDVSCAVRGVSRAILY